MIIDFIGLEWSDKTYFQMQIKYICEMTKERVIGVILNK